MRDVGSSSRNHLYYLFHPHAPGDLHYYHGDQARLTDISIFCNVSIKDGRLPRFLIGRQVSERESEAL
jgi:hypothetical protein